MSSKTNISFIDMGKTACDDAESMRPTMIEVDHVSMVFNMASQKLNNLKEYAIAIAKRELMFKEFRALDDISFTVKKGDVFGIMGTNGSGKSTMLKIIAGVLEPTEGTVEIHGNIAPLIELGAGFDHELTARENIYLNGALLGYPKKFIDKHFEEIVDFAEIRDFLDMPLKNYSSGMVARIAFAIATVMVPEILIVDEVLSVGDFMFQQKCERRIQTLIKEHDVTVLIVSHDNNQIERLCNKAIWIEKGHTRALGTAQDVCRIYSAIGGHVGSAENEQRVFEMLMDDTPVCSENIVTIAGEDRYGTAAKLFELEGASKTERADTPHGENTGAQGLFTETADGQKLLAGKNVVISQGLNPPVCMIANSFAGALEAPVLLTKPDVVPDIVSTVLKQHHPDRLFFMGSQLLSDAVITDLAALCDSDKICIENADPADLAVLAFYEAISYGGVWGKTAVITYPECIGDIISFLPYIYSQRCPLFFNSGDGVINESTAQAITDGHIERLLVLGGQISFPDACLAPFEEAQIEVIRFCGKDPYDANNMINAWITQNSDINMRELVVASIWNPEDAFAIAPYAGMNKAAIILEDPKNLDSVANAFEQIESAASQIDHLTFLGNQMRFNEQDKQLLAKALTRALEQASRGI